MSRGRPPNLPVRSPHWISYWGALEEATAQFGSKQLAIKQLDDALASGTIRCKIESAQNGAKPVLVRRTDRVAAVFLPYELCDPWEERPFISLNGKPQEGSLFLWNYDRIKYFDESAEEAAVAAPKGPATGGRPAVHDWIK